MDLRRGCRGLSVLLGTCALVLGGCGEEERPASGSVVVAQSAQPDFLDPALSYTLNGWQPMWLVYTPLLTYRRAEGEPGTELIPGLAEALPEVSRDGRTYRLRMREGLRFSDGRSVRASDFEHTIKRVLNMESPGFGYFLPIEGAQRYVDAGEADGDISGIAVDDRSRRITIRLERPDATFSHVLATNFAGVVPRGTPFESQTKSPPAGVGPFAITESVPNRRFVLERNARFDVPGIPPAKLERVTTRIIKNQERATQLVIDGEIDSILDAPAAQLLPEIRGRYGDRYRQHPTLQTIYYFLDHSQPPFDDRRAREAVSIAVRGAGMERAFGGLLQPGCGIVPPTVAGNRAEESCPWGEADDPSDLDRARALIRQAGADSASVDVWTPVEDPAGTATTTFVATLERIGLDAKAKPIDFAVYAQTVGNPATRAQAGFLAYSADFPHPLVFIDQFSADSINDEYNINPGMVRDPEIADGVAKLSKEPDLAAVAADWRALDTRVIDGAHAVAVGYPVGTTFVSDRIDIDDCALYHPVYGNDYSSWCLSD